MREQEEIQKTLANLKTIAPAGYALAFHIEFTTPTFLFQTYPNAWMKEYSEKGLVMSDPTVHWGFDNEGTTRWSDLAPMDNAGVLQLAASHGLNFGLTCSVSEGTSRSFASFSHADREFDDAEAATLLETITTLHQETAKIRTLSPETTAALQKMAVQFTGHDA